jgi:NAD(P)-dependent dehydrogenase (short-subunit alcohol dehydrogenase family)
VVAQVEALGRKAIALPLDAGAVATFPAFVQSLRAALHAHWGASHVQHLVNNAGHGAMASFADTTEAQFDALFDVHVKGVFFLTQALLARGRAGRHRPGHRQPAGPPPTAG